MRIIYTYLKRKFAERMLTAVLVLIVFQAPAQVDGDATDKTKALYGNLKKIQNSSMFLFGQEFFNSFRYSSGAAHGEEEYSDSKVVTGAHPAVLGSDFHYFLEKDPTERGFHTDAVKWAYQQGMVITFDWHLSAMGTNSYEYNGSPAGLATNIATDPNSEERAWYLEQLDAAIDIINNDLVADEDTIPIIFRPLHEMNGGWFWWGSSGISAENYKELFRLTVSYMNERTKSVLYSWSPNTPFDLSRYPGDEYVDVIGLDAYEVTISSLREQLGLAVDKAIASDKVAAFTETGNRTNDGNLSSAYWKDTILPAIANDPSGKAQKIAWVLTWINASWSFPYVPHSGSSAMAKQSFVDFKNSANTIFADELPNMYDPAMEIPAPAPVTSLRDDDGEDEKVQIFPSPSQNTVTVKLSGFDILPVLNIYNMNGQLIRKKQAESKETTFSTKEWEAGVYMLRINSLSSGKSIYEKFVVKSKD